MIPEVFSRLMREAYDEKKYKVVAFRFFTDCRVPAYVSE